MMKKSKFGCPRCNYVSKDKVKLEIKEKVSDRAPVAVVNEKQGEMYPITEHKCTHCGNKEAYFWIRQMRSGDEPESKFFKCTKCKITVRVDD
jgi:DNA-directed RNA polymerase subunit M